MVLSRTKVLCLLCMGSSMLHQRSSMAEMTMFKGLLDSSLSGVENPEGFFDERAGGPPYGTDAFVCFSPDVFRFQKIRGSPLPRCPLARVRTY